MPRKMAAMKADKRPQIEKALDAAAQGAGDYRFFLLYGPDEATSHAHMKRLERAMGQGAERIDIDAPRLRDDPAQLADEAASFSMFGDKRWIRVNGIAEDSLPAVQALLEAQAAGDPVVAVAGALKPSSKLLKYVLDSPRALAAISYQPNAREADQILMATARESGLRLSAELARRINDAVGADRTLAGNEVEKIALYLDAAPDRPREATAEAIDALAADNADDDAMPLVNAVLGGDLSAMHRELARLRMAGAHMAAVIRPLMTRAMLVAGLRIDVDKGRGSPDIVVDANKAVFWREKPAVIRQLHIWDAAGIARVIHRLAAAERMTRGRGAGDVLVQHELLAIARQAARAR